jgi:hypothetical protein
VKKVGSGVKVSKGQPAALIQQQEGSENRLLLYSIRDREKGTQSVKSTGKRPLASETSLQSTRNKGNKKQKADG